MNDDTGNNEGIEPVNSESITLIESRTTQKFKYERLGKSTDSFATAGNEEIDSIAKEFTDYQLQKIIQNRNKFDGYLHFFYLFNRKDPIERDSLLKLLAKRHEGVIHFYLPQLCQLALHRTNEKDLYAVEPSPFVEFMSSKSANSIHLALKAEWQFRAIAEDDICAPEHKIAVSYTEKIEDAVVNAEVQRISNLNKGMASGENRLLDVKSMSSGRLKLVRSGSKCSIEDPSPQMLEPNLRIRVIKNLPHKSDIPEEPSLPNSWGANKTMGKIPFKSINNVFIDSIWDKMEHPVETCKKLKTHAIDPDLICWLSKAIRCDYLGLIGKFCAHLIEISDNLAKEPYRSGRLEIATKCFQNINHWIFCRRSIVAACELTFSMKGFCIPMDRIGPDPEIWKESGKELRTEWDNRVVEVVNNPDWEEGSIQTKPNAVQILKIATKECRVLSSAKRAPYLLVMETGDLDEDLRDLVTVRPGDTDDSDYSDDESVPILDRKVRPSSPIVADIGLGTTRDNFPQRSYCWKDLYVYECVLADIQGYNLYVPSTLNSTVQREDVEEAKALQEEGVPPEDVQNVFVKACLIDLLHPEPPLDAIRRSLRLFPLGCDKNSKPRPTKTTRRLSALGESRPVDLNPIISPISGINKEFTMPAGYTPATWAPHVRQKLWGETWHEKRRRLKTESPYGRLESWDLAGVLVKGGDDLRQEFLAQQLIRVFRAIFGETGVPLWVRPYEILVTGHDSGIMEFVPDSQSFGALKQSFGNESFARCFEAAFADKLEKAQLNFVKSHAAYSLISYILNVKDRHNGNLMLLRSGHCIHIDFGFMLSSAPGNNFANMVAGGAFENSPFKLTQEIMDIIGGQESEMFDYFKRLLIYGFLQIRKNAERIMLLVEMMMTNYKMPCFCDNPEKALQEMQDRFMLNIGDESCIQNIQTLILQSINNWRSVQYDYYQKQWNKIW